MVVVAQSLSCVQLFATPWTAARQASLSLTMSRSLPKFTSIESVMPSHHLVLCLCIFYLFIYQLMDIWGCFHFLTILNNAALNITCVPAELLVKW